MRKLLLAAGLWLLALPALATQYFVNNVTGSDGNDGLGATVGGGHGPWAAPHCTALQAGDTENIAWTGTDYTAAIYCSNKATSSGTASAPITITGVPDHGRLPRITVSSGQAVQLRDNVSYMVIQYLDTYVTNASGSGFLVGSSGYAGTVHHILLQHNRVSYAGSDCMQMEFADYVTFYDNETFNCSLLVTTASGSAISMLAPTVVAGDDGVNHGCYGLPADMVATYGTNYRLCIVRNRGWNVAKGVVASDGNFIIADDFPCSQFPSINCLGVNYPYAILIAENTGFSVDGRGVHGWLIQTTVGISRFAYNTIYNACRNGSPCGSTSGVIDALGNSNNKVAGVQIDHNIVYAPAGSYAVDISNATGGSFTVCGNILFGGVGAVHTDGSAASLLQNGNVTSDPLLTNPTSSPITADFRPTASTPSPSC